MNISQIFVVILSSMLQFIVVDLFLSIFGERRYANILYYISFAFILIIINVVFTVFIEMQLLFTFLVVALIAIYSLSYKMKVIKQIFSILLISIVLILFELMFRLLYGLLYDFSIPSIQANPIVMLQVVVFSKLVLFVIIKIIKIVAKGKKGKVDLSVIFGLSVLPLTTSGVLYVLANVGYETDDDALKVSTLIVSMLLILCNLVILLMYDYIIYHKAKEDELILKSTTAMLEKEYYQNLSIKQKESSKTLHDLKNKAFALDQLIKTDIDLAEMQLMNYVELLVVRKLLISRGLKPWMDCCQARCELLIILEYNLI